MEEVAQGKVPINLLPYTSPYDPRSPWSLVLALLPETVSPSKYANLLESAMLSSDKGSLEVDTALLEHIEQTCRALGWNEPQQQPQLATQAQQAPPVVSHFMQTRIRQLDTFNANLHWPVNVAEADDSTGQYAWYYGVVRPLARYRQHYGPLSLAVFESRTPEQNLDELLRFATPTTVKRDVDALARPYLKYKQRLDALDAWVAVQPPEMLVPLSGVSQLTPSILRACYAWQQPHQRALRSIAAQLAGQETKEVKRFENLSECARILNTSLNQTAELVESDKTTQENVLRRFLADTSTNWHSIPQNLDLLCERVLAKLPARYVAEKLLSDALSRAKFSFLQSFEVEYDLLEQAVLGYVPSTDAARAPDSREVKNYIAALELLGSSRKPQVLCLKRYYAALLDLETKFSVGPKNTHNKKPAEVCQLVFEVNPKAYQKRHEIMQAVQRLESNGNSKILAEKVCYLAVSAALVDNNLNYAYSLCKELGASKDAWLAWIQVAKFVSPFWGDEPPAQVVQKQRLAIHECLVVCPTLDIPSVLSVWERLEAQQGEPENAAAFEAPSLDKVRKRDQLQQLLVSGIGWAIGANPVD